MKGTGVTRVARAGVQQENRMARLDDNRDLDTRSDGLVTDETFRTQLAAVVFEWRPSRGVAARHASTTHWMSGARRSAVVLTPS